MPLGNEVDEATITSTITQMNAADGDCDAAQRSVDATSSYLAANWTGVARDRYISSIQQWQDGLNNVKRGLMMLNTAMTSHYHNSANLEADNSNLASWT
jgi:uncharacterized protein YukE